MYPIPWEFKGTPQRKKRVYMCYFTGELCEEKYRAFDNALCIFGRHQVDADVCIIDKERISPEAWNALLKGFGIKEIPALVVSYFPLNIENALEEGSEYKPPPEEKITVYTPEDIRKYISDADKFLNSLLKDPSQHKRPYQAKR